MLAMLDEIECNYIENYLRSCSVCMHLFLPLQPKSCLVKPPEDLLPEEEYDKKLNDLFATTDIDRAGKTLDDMFFSTASTSDQDSKVDIFQDLEVTEGGFSNPKT
nr:hypothetical transcript [Hymenolepis microstoma]